MEDAFTDIFLSVITSQVPLLIFQVVVEYGADLHTFDHGSGFPTRSNTSDPDDEVISRFNSKICHQHHASYLHFRIPQQICLPYSSVD